VKRIRHFFFLLFITTIFIHAEPLDNLIANGRKALQQKNQPAAHSTFLQALEQYPDHPQAQFYMGVFHYYANNPTRALPYLQRSYKLDPENMQFLNACATVANHAGQFMLARDIIEAHYGAEPRDAGLRTKLLPIYIRNRDWHYASKLCTVSDLWWHNDDITNQSVLLDLSSQWNGHGDVFQIVRYAKHLKDAGAHVTVYVRPELAPLLSLCPYLDRIVPTTHPKPTLAKEYSLTTDRFILATHTTTHIPSKDIPYLYADETLCTKWQKRLAPYNTYKIGICFQSSKMQDYFSGKTIPGPRGMYGSQINPLLDVRGVSFFSLHPAHEPEAKQLCSNHTFHVFDDLDVGYGAFMDSAALIKQLDLVITVDTAIAHLAGALGVPVWVMMPHATDFRWFNADENCPWYPTMKFFVQKEQGEWNEVVQRVKQSLLARHPL